MSTQARCADHFRSLAISCATALALTCGSADADVKLPAVITSNMVLQQSSNAPIWGWAEPGEVLTVKASWLPAAIRTTADASGRWLVKLKTPAAAEARTPGTLTIAAANTITLDNIAIGEVWLASGQSNMEWPLAAAKNAAQEIADANHPQIRYFAPANEMAIGPRKDCTAQPGGWRVLSPATAPECTAVGYFFARELQSTLGIPVGIIASDWGGTPVEAWTSGETLQQLGEYKDYLTQLNAIDPDPLTRDKKLSELTQSWWTGVDQNPKAPGPSWNTAGFNDASWKTIAVPSVWGAELAGFDGFLYLRRTIDVPAALVGQPAKLDLGAIDDRDDAFINGTPVGSSRGNWMSSVPRSYEVPAGVLKAGANTIALRIRDDQGPGGISAQAEQVALRIGNASIPLAGDWKYTAGPSTAELPMPPLYSGLNPGFPTVLYNAMIHPLVNYTIRGAIWYQGESNRGRPEQYLKVFSGMIQSWRKQWNLGEFPFYFVQIAPYNYGNDPGLTAELRDAQTATLAQVKNTGMVCTMDIGDPKDIHPANKQDVGRRLALLALKNTYGKAGIVASGPMYESMKIDGSSIVITFKLDGSTGLDSKGGAPTHLQIAGADRIFHRATGVIEGKDTLRVRCDDVEHPEAVRYGWEGPCEPNLCSKDGLPAVPFRTDSWERPKGGWASPVQ